MLCQILPSQSEIKSKSTICHITEERYVPSYIRVRQTSRMWCNEETFSCKLVFSLQCFSCTVQYSGHAFVLHVHVDTQKVEFWGHLDERPECKGKSLLRKIFTLVWSGHKYRQCLQKWINEYICRRVCLCIKGLLFVFVQIFVYVDMLIFHHCINI